MHASDTARKAVRWAAVAIAAAVALRYLFSAAYGVWAASGPPTPLREWWIQRAFAHLCYAGVALALGVAVLLAIHALRVTRGAAVLAALALLLVAMPRARAFLLVDGCLDRGGRWDAPTFTCER